MDLDGSAPDACGSRGRPRVLTDEARRRQLLETAEAVFLTAGYHATTMDDVARTAGMSKKTVYQVFASKADLFEALLNDRFLPLTIAVEDSGRPLEETLVSLLRRLAGVCLAPRQIAMTRLMIAEATLSRDMAQALERLGVGRGCGVLERWITAQAESGALAMANPQEAANALFFTAIGEALLHALLRMANLPDEAVMEQRIGYAVALFLKGAG